MARLPKEVASFMEKYGVTSDEIWAVPGGKSYAVKHIALERVAAENGIAFDAPTIIQNEKEAVAMVVRVKMGDWSDWTTGEAAKTNCKNAYLWAMAEKRAKDRGTLKALKVHGALYSEDEADDFKRRDNPHVTTPSDISDGKVEYDENGEIIDNIPHIEDVRPLPKAKSRELYAELEKEMLGIDSEVMLLGWAKAAAAQAATLDDSFREILRRRYSEHLGEIRAAREAAE